MGIRVEAYELAENFAKDKSSDIPISDRMPLAADKNGKRRYRFSNMFYVFVSAQHIPRSQAQAFFIFSYFFHSPIIMT